MAGYALMMATVVVMLTVLCLPVAAVVARAEDFDAVLAKVSTL